MSATRQPIFTIGHSTHALETFIDLLQRNEVTALVDVRSAPYSRFNPHFNKEALARHLRDLRISYVYLGRELGGRGNDRDSVEQGRFRYAHMARTELFRSGLDRVLRGAETHRIALMCAEKEPLECHRTLLVARALHDNKVEVRHILGDGRLEAHEATMERLLDLFKMPRQDLFRSHDDLVAEAIDRQADRVAWVNYRPTAGAAGDRR